MDQLHAMRVFARIAEAGSFVKAADSLNIPKPTATKLVQTLEAHLGVKLLQRTTRRVSVTPEGALYLEQSNRLLAELEELDARMASHRATPKGRLRVDTSPALAERVLIPALPSFYARYPQIQIVLGVSDRTVDLVAEGVDCAIRGGTLADTSLVARRLAELDFVTCASPQYVAAHGMPQHPEQLHTGHQIVGYFSALSGRHAPLQFTRGTDHVEVHQRPIFSANESAAHAGAMVAGLGIGQTPRFIVQPYLDTGALLPLLGDWHRELQPVQVVYPSSRHLNARLRVFVDWAVEVFATLRPPPHSP